VNLFLILTMALAIDYIFGDPKLLWKNYPHPAVLMGRMIGWFDAKWNKGRMRKAKGLVAITLMSFVGLLIGSIFWILPNTGILGLIFAVIQAVLLSVLLAHKSLIHHVREVASALSETLPAGRQAVSAIVSRDVRTLDEAGVSRAAIESGAENFSDGLIAPAFWFLILGFPGVLAYKIVNTADSMIGYRTEEYEDFGFGAAKLDDVLNFIPSRLSGLLICAAHFSQNAYTVMNEDAYLHRSPNAGWPEAAMAVVTDVALSGPRIYDGVATNDSFVHRMGRRDATDKDITASVKALNRTWSLFFGCVTLLGMVGFALF
jgi:adenosylcobinamide-phosphate synthase